MLKKLWVVAVVSNPVRFSSRYNLYLKFMDGMKRAGVNVLTVELQLGDRAFQLTEAGNPHHVQLRCWDELWHKENMINIGISRLPHDWEYVCWIDADVHFANPNWAFETVQQLQHYQIVQMFQNAVDLGPSGEVLQTHNGFMWSYLQGKPFGKGYSHWHPGYAWAARREAIDAVGGLLDIAILGAGDHHMALAMIGRAKSLDYNKSQQEFHKMGADSEYVNAIFRWQDRCERFIGRDVGFVPGTILHDWHGRKRDRKYLERWQILIQNKYDPRTDLKRDWQLLYQLTGENIKLRDDIRRYMRSRNEDSIDL